MGYPSYDDSTVFEGEDTATPRGKSQTVPAHGDALGDVLTGDQLARANAVAIAARMLRGRDGKPFGSSSVIAPDVDDVIQLATFILDGPTTSSAEPFALGSLSDIFGLFSPAPSGTPEYTHSAADVPPDDGNDYNEDESGEQNY